MVKEHFLQPLIFLGILLQLKSKIQPKFLNIKGNLQTAVT